MIDRIQCQTWAGDSREIDEVAKEWEHTLLQNSMDKELHELNRRLEEKEVLFSSKIISNVKGRKSISSKL